MSTRYIAVARCDWITLTDPTVPYSRTVLHSTLQYPCSTPTVPYRPSLLLSYSTPAVFRRSMPSLPFSLRCYRTDSARAKPQPAGEHAAEHEIVFLIAPTRAIAEASPYYEAFAKNDREVGQTAEQHATQCHAEAQCARRHSGADHRYRCALHRLPVCLSGALWCTVARRSGVWHA